MNSAIDTLNLNIDNVTNLPKMTQFDYDYTGNTVLNSGAFFVFLAIFVIVIYLTLFMSSSSTTTAMAQPEVSSSSSFETVLLVIFIGLVAMNMLKYFFNIDIKASLVDVFSKEPELDIEINKLDNSLLGDTILPSDKMTEEDEVFHISDNVYTYEDAKGICGAFGGRLANYFDIEKAYEKGGEWCSYGWSDDQMVFFPTQKTTYERLKKQGRQNDCGRTGINGGFIGNPNARFGVNCVGKKPKITPEKQDLLYEIQNAPQTMSDVIDQKSLNFWREKKDDMDVAPFNSNKWNM